MVNDLEGKLGGEPNPARQKPPVDRQKPQVISTEETQVDPSSPPMPAKRSITDTSKYRSFQLTGQTLAGVSVEEGIKQGGMCAVYKGIDVASKVPVILKVLRSEILEITDKEDRAKAIARFAKDANSTSKLKHSNIVETVRFVDYDPDKPDNIPIIVYKFIEGAKDLSELLKVESPVTLSLDNSASIMHQMGEALMHAHSQNVIHRDVKPGNILVDPKTLHAWLIDFGLAKDLEGELEKSVTQPGTLLGTPAYIAPEQAKNAKDNITSAVDLYSWACTAYEAFTHLAPFEQRTTNLSTALYNRQEKEISYELWVNEAIEVRRAELAEELKLAKDPPKKQQIESLLANLVPVSDELEDLIMLVLCAKNPEERPSFGIVMQKYEQLIADKKLVRRELTAEEQADTAGKRLALEEAVKTYRNELAPLAESKDRDGIKKKNTFALRLANKLEALVALMPRTDDARAVYMKESSELYLKVFTSVRNKEPIVTEITFTDLEDSTAWAAGLNRLEQERKRHRETKLLAKDMEAAAESALYAIKNNDISDASQQYGKINHARLPSHLKGKVEDLTAKVEQIILKGLQEGLVAISKSADDLRAKMEALKAANSHYRNVALLVAVLPDSAKETKDKAVKFLQTIRKREYNLFLERANDAAPRNDYFIIYECAEGIEACVDDLPADIANEAKKHAAKLMASVKDHKEDISLLRTYMNSTRDLRRQYIEDLTAAEKDIASQGQSMGLAVLPKDKIDDYLSKIEEKIEKVKSSVKKVHIGPGYDAFLKKLEDFQDDVKAEEHALKLGEAKDFAQKAGILHSLIMHHHGRNNDQKERLYITAYKALISDHERQIPHGTHD